MQFPKHELGIDYAKVEQLARIFFSVKMCGLYEKTCPVSSVSIILDRVFVSPWETHIPIIQRNSILFQLLPGLIYRLDYLTDHS